MAPLRAKESTIGIYGVLARARQLEMFQLPWTSVTAGGVVLLRSTLVVDGPLAMRMQRIAAAREGTVGREILTLPLLASRLAGGFIAPAGMDVLYPAAQSALSAGGFRNIGKVSLLPGMPRAILQSLNAVWRADIDLSSLPKDVDRFADLNLLEKRIRGELPPARMLPRDLRDRAMARVTHAPNLLGSITLTGIVNVDPVWRPLLNELASICDVTWNAHPRSDKKWFKRKILPIAAAGPRTTSAEVSADPKSEVVEALRWARQLLASGQVEASEVAIAATSPQEWDDHFLAYSASAELPLHFSHGIPSLSTPDGQACAALADILTSGISQERVWRLIRRLPRRPFADSLPTDWFAGLPRRAGLRTLNQWRQGLSSARSQRPSGELAEQILLPVLELLSRGPDASHETGRLLLSGSSLIMWEEALRRAPPHAISLTLVALRVSDERDPGNSVVWCPASHLAASPRPFTRLLGMTSRSWPRFDDDDPLIPDHLLKRRRLHPITTAERDRLHFEAIRDGTRELLVLSRAQRSAKGSFLSSSSLWPTQEALRKRDRIPEHAFSEADRLLARPQDAGKRQHVRQSLQGWRNWHWESALTAHDGLVTAGHPVIEAALARPQSTTTLQRLLRDPLGFVWREALGWRSVRLEAEPLQLDPAAFGELVHELISSTITRLEPTGFARATPTEIDDAIEAAASTAMSSWPLHRSVPPPVLWRHTVDEAARRTARGLAADPVIRADTRSWPEVPFGQAASAAFNLPWDATGPIAIDQTGLVYRGRIDRLDVTAEGDAAQITDYKSTKPPPKKQRIALAQGRELQRVLYAMAVRTLLPDVRTVVARLVYLADDPATFELRGDQLDQAINEATTYLAAAVAILRSGQIAPRWEQDPFYDDMRLALPADRESYLRRKSRVFRGANQTLERLWRATS